MNKYYKYSLGRATAVLPGLLLILFTLQIRAQKDPCWNIFRGDQALTGKSNIVLPEKPGLLWSFKTSDEIRSSPVVCDNRIIAGSADGTVYCLDMKGTLLWSFPTGNMIEAPAMILDGQVYAGNMDGTLFCIDLKTGKEIWNYKTGSQISGSPNWWKTNARTSILVGSYDFNLHCVDAATGKNLWKYESDNYINGAPACLDGSAIFGGCDGYLHIVALSDGTLKRKIEVGTYVAGSAALGGKFAYIGDYDGKISCIEMTTGKIIWQWEDINARQPFLASPALLKDRVITANRDKYVYCFAGSSGELLWKFNSGARVDASPVIAGNKVITCNMRGDIILLDAQSGKALWTYELGSPVTGNAAVSSGRFFVGAADGYIYCFGNSTK
jgi:outer membrane protein assembly factor BamB